MAIDKLKDGSASSGSEQFSFLVDYDTVAETIGLTCSGTGHAQLTVVQTSNGNSLGALYADQFGSTTGTLAAAGSVDNAGQPDAGESDGPVTYNGTRVIVLGPGATGVDVTGAALASRKVTSQVVGQFNVPHGQTPGLGITLDWGPNSFTS